jgi:hypothetical protein
LWFLYKGLLFESTRVALAGQNTGKINKLTQKQTGAGGKTTAGILFFFRNALPQRFLAPNS